MSLPSVTSSSRFSLSGSAVVVVVVIVVIGVDDASDSEAESSSGEGGERSNVWGGEAENVTRFSLISLEGLFRSIPPSR